jgi:hypothetical protein
MSFFTGAAKTALLVAGAFLGSFTATLVRDAGGEARRLADVYVAATTMSTGKGCLSIAATATKDLSGDNCDSTYCPDCFYFTGSGDLTFTLSNCQTSKWGSSNALGAGDVATAVRQYTFVNTMTGNTATVSDGTNSMVIPAKGSAVAYCFTGISNTLHFPYNAGSNGCPNACDAATPTDISGAAFTTVVHPTVSIACSTTITTDGSSTATGGVCTTR